MPRSRLAQTAIRFQRDEGGAVLVWVTIMIVLVVGLIGLAIDGSRYLNLNSNLQEVADAAALAGAKELDGAEDAITRATDAAVHYLDNDPKWSNIPDPAVQIVATGPGAPTFYSSINPDVETTDPRLASYIRVRTVDRGLSPSFIVVYNTSDVYTAATAMAKSSFSVCKPLQSFMCNPFEGESGYTPGTSSNWLENVGVGSMLYLAGGTGGASGNWGLIMPPDSNGNPHDQSPFWANDAPGSCPAVDVGDAGDEVDPGNNSQFAEPGMNVRFDNPQKTLGTLSVSAPVVIDGYRATDPSTNTYNCENSVPATLPSGALTFSQTCEGDLMADNTLCPDTTAYTNYDNYCNASPAVGSCPLPRDREFTQYGGQGGWKGALIGNGVNRDDLAAYWNNHHSGVEGPLPDDVTTRYQVYELEASGDAAFTSASNALEPSMPQCKKSIVGDAARRLINVAIVDCNYWGISGASNKLPITTTVAQFFMTEPATNGFNSDLEPSDQGRIYAEVVKTFQINDPGGAVYQIVQLVK